MYSFSYCSIVLLSLVLIWWLAAVVSHSCALNISLKITLLRYLVGEVL